ncbi:hypothetical protein FSP39_020216 [Pinctada imbricata]|uniref:RNA helicase n=1 Tax=Pinctada imbricata TaxID=66713 RepID=A0AA88YEN3_PINIB|nr:hypothetical protein FSP39_020216 [Pinctada imbricata]
MAADGSDWLTHFRLLLCNRCTEFHETLQEASTKGPLPNSYAGAPQYGGPPQYDLIVQAKSGTGKTCVFTVIALESIQVDTSALQVLVLAPTREIAIQIWDVIKSVGSAIPSLQCQTFIGGMPVQEDKLKLKRCHIAVGTPGRIKQMIESNIMKTESIRMFILDEADKLLEESFQEQINWIYSSLPDNKQMLALSATYPEYLAQHLTAYMRNPTFLRLNISDPALLGIKQFKKIVAFHPLPSKQFEYKMNAVVDILSSVNFQQCLMFSNLQTRAQNISHSLNSKGWPTAYIAGSHDQRDRNEAMAKLKTYKCRVLVSTDLTARGIDADKVNLVINLDVPKHHETYLHRIGRAGRFGSFGAAVTIVCVGQEEMDLYRTEQRCNTSIKDLPDPVPSTLTKSNFLVRLDDMVSTEKIYTDSTRLPSPTKGKKDEKHINLGGKERTIQAKEEHYVDNNFQHGPEIKMDKAEFHCNDSSHKDDKVEEKLLKDETIAVITRPQIGQSSLGAVVPASNNDENDFPSNSVGKVENNSVSEHKTVHSSGKDVHGSSAGLYIAETSVLKPASKDMAEKDSGIVTVHSEKANTKSKKSKQASPKEMSTRKIAKARRRFYPSVNDNSNSEGNVKVEAVGDNKKSGMSSHLELEVKDVMSLEKDVTAISLKECNDSVNETSTYVIQKAAKSLEAKNSPNGEAKRNGNRNLGMDNSPLSIQEVERARQNGYKLPSLGKMIGYEEICDSLPTEKYESGSGMDDQPSKELNVKDIFPSVVQMKSEEIQESILHVKNFLDQRQNKIKNTKICREVGIQTESAFEIQNSHNFTQKTLHDKCCETDQKESMGVDIEEIACSNVSSKKGQKSRNQSKACSYGHIMERNKGKTNTSTEKDSSKKCVENVVFHTDIDNAVIYSDESDNSSSNDDSENETDEESGQSRNRMSNRRIDYTEKNYFYEVDGPLEYDIHVNGNPQGRNTQNYQRSKRHGKHIQPSVRQPSNSRSCRRQFVEQSQSFYGQNPHFPWGSYLYPYGLQQYYRMPYLYHGMSCLPSSLSRSWVNRDLTQECSHNISKFKLIERSMKMQKDYIRNMLRH